MTTQDTARADTMRATALAAKAAGAKLVAIGAEGRSALLRALAKALRDEPARKEIFAANAADMERAKAEGVASPLVKRLGLDAGKLEGVCEGLEQLAAMPDLVGKTTLRRELDDGLVLERVTAPAGSARRRVRVAPRRPGADRRAGLEERQRRPAQGRPRGAGHQPRADGGHPPRPDGGGRRSARRRAARGTRGRGGRPGLHGIVEVIVARGSSEFVREIMAKSDIPVMGHAAGVCHIYVHAGADPAMAARLTVDGKTTTRRPATPPRRCCGTRARPRPSTRRWRRWKRRGWRSAATRRPASATRR